MGYDLHITRKASWHDPEGPTIGEAEWRSLVEADPEMSLDAENADGQWVPATWKGEGGALAWYRGEIRRKHPDKLLIIKMVEIAAALGATVQGDDGEIYRADGSSYHPEPAAPPARPGFVRRIGDWFHARQAARRLRAAAPAFAPGSRVRDAWGETGTVIDVDPRANHGLGRVRVRLDDGREQSVALIASGLELADDAAAPRI